MMKCDAISAVVMHLTDVIDGPNERRTDLLLTARSTVARNASRVKKQSLSGVERV